MNPIKLLFYSFTQNRGALKQLLDKEIESTVGRGALRHNAAGDIIVDD